MRLVAVEAQGVLYAVQDVVGLRLHVVLAQNVVGHGERGHLARQALRGGAQVLQLIVVHLVAHVADDAQLL